MRTYDEQCSNPCPRIEQKLPIESNPLGTLEPYLRKDTGMSYSFFPALINWNKYITNKKKFEK